MSRTVIVRHGDTFAPGEPPRRIGARTDLPLVASGTAQALALRAHFEARGMRFARVLAGPLQRTQQTARLLLADLPRPPVVETAAWLAEVDHGPDEDQPEAVVLARIGADAMAAWDADATPPPGWLVDVPARIDAWRGFLAAPGMGDTLLVTSNGAARFALLARPELKRNGPLKLRTGGYGEVQRDEAGALALLGWDIRPPMV